MERTGTVEERFGPMLLQTNSFTYTDMDYRPARTDVWTTTAASLAHQLKTSVEAEMEKDAAARDRGESNNSVSFRLLYDTMLK